MSIIIIKYNSNILLTILNHHNHFLYEICNGLRKWKLMTFSKHHKPINSLSKLIKKEKSK